MKKYFTETQTNVATFIGGPVAGGLLIYRNFLKLGRKPEAQITLAVTFLLTVSLAVLIFNIPESVMDKIPNSVFASLYTVISAIVFSHFLKKEIKHKFDEGAKKSSNWLVTAYTFAGLLINVAILLAVGFNQPPFEGDKLEFGTNEVYYDKGNVSLEEIQKTATTLRYYGYFTNETQNAVRMEKNDTVFKRSNRINWGFANKS